MDESIKRIPKKLKERLDSGESMSTTYFGKEEDQTYRQELMYFVNRYPTFSNESDLEKALLTLEGQINQHTFAGMPAVVRITQEKNKYVINLKVGEKFYLPLPVGLAPEQKKD